MSLGNWIGLISVLAAILGGTLTVWINTSNKITALEIKVQGLEKAQDYLVSQYNETVDKIFKQLNDIREMLHDKQDRE